VSVPLILCALAGTLCERSGVIDLGLEGKMLSCCLRRRRGRRGQRLARARRCSRRSSVGLALSMLHAYACVTHRGDQVVMGMAITMTAAGLTVVLGIAWFKQGGQTPPCPTQCASRLVPRCGHHARQAAADRHAARARAARPQRDGLRRARRGGIVWWLLFRTRFGLRLRATGENPAMVDAAGVSVRTLRTLALAGNGVLCSLAGAYLVLAQNPSSCPT
jgi:simple sugar transport system permease protein